MTIRRSFKSRSDSFFGVYAVLVSFPCFPSFFLLFVLFESNSVLERMALWTFLLLVVLSHSLCAATVYSVACGAGSYPLSVSLSSLLSLNNVVNFLGLATANSCAYSMEEDLWVAIGTSSVSSPYTVAWSRDGQNWTGVANSATMCSSGVRVASGGGVFLILCSTASSSMFFLDTWTTPSSPTLVAMTSPQPLYLASDVTYSEQHATWVVVGTSDSSSTPAVATTRDATSAWTTQSLSSTGLTSALSVSQGAQDGFLIGGCCRSSTFSALLHSSDAATWTPVPVVTNAAGSKYPVLAYGTDNRLWSTMTPDAALNVNAGVRGSPSFGSYAVFSSTLVVQPLSNLRYLQRQHSFVGLSALGDVVGDSSSTTWTLQLLTNLLTTVSDIASRLIEDRTILPTSLMSTTTIQYSAVVPTTSVTSFQSALTIVPLDVIKYPDMASLNCFGQCSFHNNALVSVTSNVQLRSGVIVRPTSLVQCNQTLLIRSTASLTVELPTLIPVNTTMITLTPFKFSQRQGSFASVSLTFSAPFKKKSATSSSTRGSSTVTYSDGCTQAGPAQQQYSSSSMSVLIPVTSTCNGNGNGNGGNTASALQTNSSTTTPSSSSSSSSSFPLGAIIGIAVGGACLLGALLALAVYLYMKIRRHQIQIAETDRIREANLQTLR